MFVRSQPRCRSHRHDSSTTRPLRGGCAVRSHVAPPVHGDDALHRDVERLRELKSLIAARRTAPPATPTQDETRDALAAVVFYSIDDGASIGTCNRRSSTAFLTRHTDLSYAEASALVADLYGRRGNAPTTFTSSEQ